VGARDVLRVLDGHAGDRGLEPPPSSFSFGGLTYTPQGAAVPVRAAGWRPDGRLAATGTHGTTQVNRKLQRFGRVHLWDPNTAQARAVLATPALAVDWSANGARLAALGLGDGAAVRATVWEVRDGPDLEVVERGRFDVVVDRPLGDSPRALVRLSPD